MSDTLIWQARLTEAETALHQLQTGKLVRVAVDQNGERVEFTAANSDKLRSYIAELRAKIAGANPAPRPIGFLF